MDMNLSKLLEIAKDRKTWHAAVRGVTKGWTQLSDLTELNTDKWNDSSTQVRIGEM